MSLTPKTPPDLRRPWFRFVQWSDELIGASEATPGSSGPRSRTRCPSPRRSRRRSRRAAARRHRSGRWPGVQHNVSDGYFQLDGHPPAQRPHVWTRGSPDRSPTHRRTARRHGSRRRQREHGRVLWPDRPAIGQALWLPDDDRAVWREVVGVVEDIQFHAVGETSRAARLRPVDAVSDPAAATAGQDHRPRRCDRRVVAAVAQQMSIGSNIDQIVPLDALVSRATAQPRFTSRVVATFGTLALLLAGVGIYGTLVVHGEHAAGARSASAWRSAHRASGCCERSCGAGLRRRWPARSIGGSAAVAMARTFRALLFNVTSLDPVSLGGAVAVLLLVATGAALGPAAWPRAPIPASRCGRSEAANPRPADRTRLAQNSACVALPQAYSPGRGHHTRRPDAVRRR